MASFLERYWLFIVAFLLVSIVCGGTVLAVKQSSHQTTEITLSPANPIQNQGEIYIGGAVANPGFYPLKESDSIETLIQAAGPMSDADLSHIKIQIPKTGETNPPQRININRAEAWLIETLPGIGHEKAQAIVDYRSKYGPFHRIEDLFNINGIGRTTLDKIRDLITVED
jgi:competence protein ComEA